MRVLKEPITACHENWYSRGLEIIIWDYYNLLESYSSACQSLPDKIYHPYTSSLYSAFPCTNSTYKSNFIMMYLWERNSCLNARDGFNTQLISFFLWKHTKASNLICRLISQLILLFQMKIQVISAQDFVEDSVGNSLLPFLITHKTTHNPLEIN